MMASQVGWCADLEQAASGATPRGNLRFRVADLLEDRPAAIIEQQTFVGQSKPTGAAVGEADTELGFQSGQPAADRSR